ncbi:hypothetical protein B0H11DRAFT_2250487 [Mycena galericulata]|nr:hypothetical protein B0H11DRAFT_2250487 [Mycena galericulata]
MLSPRLIDEIHALPQPSFLDTRNGKLKILKSRKKGKGHQYLIKWKGFPHSGNTWEPARNITHAKKMLKEFNKKHNIHTRAIPIFKPGHWDYLIRRFKPKQESLPYSTRRLFDPDTGKFTAVPKPSVNEDVDLKEGGLTPGVVTLVRPPGICLPKPLLKFPNLTYVTMDDSECIINEA